MRSVWYRLQQFLASLGALIGPLDEGEAERLLNPPANALFRKMARYDRAHSLRVLRYLREKGADDSALLQAALLHDIGKSAGRERIPLFYRGPIVLTKRCPRLWAWLSQKRPVGDPRRPFYLYRTHARRGAELARTAGLPQEIVDLVANHHSEKAEGQVRLLQEADSRA